MKHAVQIANPKTAHVYTLKQESLDRYTSIAESPLGPVDALHILGLATVPLKSNLLLSMRGPNTLPVAANPWREWTGVDDDPIPHN